MLSTVSVNSPSFVLCCYINRTDQVQVLRIVNIEQWYFEKVIFPQQRLMFNAPLEGEMEVYTSDAEQSGLIARIKCQELLVSHL